jgi:hypothetical protein
MLRRPKHSKIEVVEPKEEEEIVSCFSGFKRMPEGRVM